MPCKINRLHICVLIVLEIKPPMRLKKIRISGIVIIAKEEPAIDSLVQIIVETETAKKERN